MLMLVLLGNLATASHLPGPGFSRPKTSAALRRPGQADSGSGNERSQKD